MLSPSFRTSHFFLNVAFLPIQSTPNPVLPPNIPNHNPQNPTIDSEERQSGQEKSRVKCALTKKLESVGLLEPHCLVNAQRSKSNTFDKILGREDLPVYRPIELRRRYRGEEKRGGWSGGGRREGGLGTRGNTV